MNFDSISEEFQTDKTYLNNASVSVMPKTSIEAMKQFLIDYSEIGPDSPESVSYTHLTLPPILLV